MNENLYSICNDLMKKMMVLDMMLENRSSKGDPETAKLVDAAESVVNLKDLPAFRNLKKALREYKA